MHPADWHTRFSQQASWTRPAREYLFSVTGLPAASRVLEVGCGTGAVLADVAYLLEAQARTSDRSLSEPKGGALSLSKGSKGRALSRSLSLSKGSKGRALSLPKGAAIDTHSIHGLDINSHYLSIARKTVPSARLVCGDAHRLPYRSASFDACLCHFFLMWVDAAAALADMRRVTRPGGWILALAEPDYGGRIDYPEELSRIGRLQAESLRRQGADANAGRKLTGLFHQAGLVEVRTGVIGGEWAGSDSSAGLENEWQVIRSDLRAILAPAELERLHDLDEQSWRGGTRVLYVPVFYAAGRVPD